MTLLIKAMINQVFPLGSIKLIKEMYSGLRPKIVTDKYRKRSKAGGSTLVGAVHFST